MLLEKKYCTPNIGMTHLTIQKKIHKKKMKLCKEYKQEIFYEWCQPCNTRHFTNDFYKWTSGSYIVDKFIQKFQLNAKDEIKIPYDRFEDIKEVAKSGSVSIYRAKWIDGYIEKWEYVNVLK